MKTNVFLPSEAYNSIIWSVKKKPAIVTTDTLILTYAFRTSDLTFCVFTLIYIIAAINFFFYLLSLNNSYIPLS
jgi:hypothetical protein